MGSFSEAWLPEAAAGAAGVCVMAGGAGVPPEAGEEEELWDIITPVNNISIRAGKKRFMGTPA